MRRAGRIVTALALAASLAACGGSDPLATAVEKDLAQLEVDLPGEILGLTVEQEATEDIIEGARPSYAEALALFSLRKGELLQATLQIARFHEESEFDTDRFRRTIVNLVGSTAPRPVRLGSETVWLSAETRQKLSMWFSGDRFYVLAVREDFPLWRTLLRQAMAVTA